MRLYGYFISHRETINHIINPSPIVEKNTMIGKRRDDLLDRRARKGEISKEKLGQYIECLELALVVAGGIVVVGLIVEDGPELWRSLLTWTRPPRAALGDLLVTVGVFSEVLIAFVIAGVARRLNAYAEADTARALERAAKAEGAAALANEKASKLESDNITLRTDLERAFADSASAELQLRQYIDRKSGPRRINRERFLEMLKGKTTGMVTIWYKPEDVEAFNFANQIFSLLVEAGWNSGGPLPFRTVRQIRPSEFVHGGWFGSGVTVKYKNPPVRIGENTAGGALMDAISAGWECCESFDGLQDPALKENEFQIVIGQKK
jgi:hypothetical protein